MRNLVINGLHVAGQYRAGICVDLKLIFRSPVDDFHLILRPAIVPVQLHRADVGLSSPGHIGKSNTRCLVLTDIRARKILLRTVISLCVVVKAEDLPGAGVDLVVIFLIIIRVELYLIYSAAVLPILLNPDKVNLAGAQPSVGQGLALGLLLRNEAAGGALSAGAGPISLLEAIGLR